MNWENIRRTWIEIGMPIMLIGMVIQAIGWIVGYIIQTIYGVSHPIMYGIILLGMIVMVIGAFSIVIVVKRI